MRETYPRSFRLYAFLTVLCAASLPTGPPAGKTYISSVHHDFEPTWKPLAAVLEASGGNLYSTTLNSGENAL